MLRSNAIHSHQKKKYEELSVSVSYWFLRSISFHFLWILHGLWSKLILLFLCFCSLARPFILEISEIHVDVDCNRNHSSKNRLNVFLFKLFSMRFKDPWCVKFCICWVSSFLDVRLKCIENSIFCNYSNDIVNWIHE